MIYHIALCVADAGLRALLRRHCEGYFSRRGGACAFALYAGPEALLAADAAGRRYELAIIELAEAPAGASQGLPTGLAAAVELRRRGRLAPLAFVAHSAAWAYYAYRADALQYLPCPPDYDAVAALLRRVVEPEYGPALTLPTAAGLRVIPFAQIEYVECTQHVVHFHLTDGSEAASLSQRTPFLQLAAPLLEDGRFIQSHRSYLLNLAEVRLLGCGEAQMASGARLPVPQGREPAVRRALADFHSGGRAVTGGPSPAPTSDAKTGC